jgi:hypothetical protein
VTSAKSIAAAAWCCCCRASGEAADALRELQEAERKLQEISSQEAQMKVGQQLLLLLGQHQLRCVP